MSIEFGELKAVYVPDEQVHLEHRVVNAARAWRTARLEWLNTTSSPIVDEQLEDATLVRQTQLSEAIDALDEFLARQKGSE